MKIKYNRYINKIGIEFEGLYDPDGLIKIKEMQKNGFVEITTDGSIVNDEYVLYLEEYEVRTIPCNEKTLLAILSEFDILYADGQYRINSSCGLHYHISVVNEVYGALGRETFYDCYINMFSEFFPEIYRARANNTYCKALCSEDDYTNFGYHFTRSSPFRYYAVNYCYNKHKTIEFRLFGGEYATIKTLAECIQRTIDLIGTFVKQKTYEIEIPIEHEETIRTKRVLPKRLHKKLPIEIVDTIQKKNPYIESETLHKKIADTIIEEIPYTNRNYNLSL